MTRLFKISLGHCAFASFAFTLSACGVFWAGGVDEEQNTVAGVAEDASTDDPIIADNPNITCVTVNDTTICVSRASLDVKNPADSVIQVIDTISENPTIVDKGGDSIGTPVPTEVVKNSYSIVGYVPKNLESNNSIEIALVDTTYYVKGNSDGMFEITVPEGTYSFVVKSVGNSGYVSESNYYLTYNSGVNVLGPVPTSVAGNVDAEDLEAPPVQTVEIPPTVGMSPDPQPSDTSSTEMPPQDTSSNNSDAVILLPHEPDYGLVYHWDATNMPANESSVNDSLVFANELEELTFEITFKINAFPESLYYSKNVFGKKGLFNLAITRSKCLVQEPSFAFFIGNGFDFSSCYDKAVVSSATIEVGKEITVTGVWDGKHVMLYKDGFLIAEQTLTKIADINYITADNILETPFVFGDKELDISIIDARLGNKAISSADVLYRHYLKGGAQ